jgi:ABC-type transporter Mla MlaB component
MLKITPFRSNRTTTLRVEGRLTQSTVEQLTSTAESCLAGRSNLELDLSELRFVDHEGASALRKLARRGALLLGCSGFLHELLRERSHVD